MKNDLLSRSRFTLVTLLFVFALNACDGGGAGGDGSDLPPGSEMPPTGETPFSIDTDIVGDAVPGQTITLIAGGDADAALDLLWEQTGGPSVTLESTAGNAAQFRVPPVSRDTSFSFQVSVTGADGNAHQSRVHVKVEALSWKPS